MFVMTLGIASVGGAGDWFGHESCAGVVSKPSCQGQAIEQERFDQW